MKNDHTRVIVTSIEKFDMMKGSKQLERINRTYHSQLENQFEALEKLQLRLEEANVMWAPWIFVM